MNDDEVLAHNRRVQWVRLLVWPLVATAVMVLTQVCWDAAKLPQAPNKSVVFAVGCIVAFLLLGRWSFVKAVPPGGRAALEWGQWLLARRRAQINVNVITMLAAATGALFVSSRDGAILLTILTTFFALSASGLVMRPPRSYGAIVEDEFVWAMRARSISLGFFLILLSFANMAFISAFRSDWLTREIAPALAIPVAAMGWRFVWLTRGSGRDE